MFFSIKIYLKNNILLLVFISSCNQRRSPYWRVQTAKNKLSSLKQHTLPTRSKQNLKRRNSINKSHQHNTIAQQTSKTELSHHEENPMKPTTSLQTKHLIYKWSLSILTLRTVQTRKTREINQRILQTGPHSIIKSTSMIRTLKTPTPKYPADPNIQTQRITKTNTNNNTSG